MDSSWVLSAVVAVVAACALLAASGFRGRPDTVGIDLGTTFSVIALRTPDGTQVLRDDADRALVPSAVYFGEGGRVLVGHDATAFQLSDPAHVIFNAKRFIGKSFNDTSVQAQRAVHPFEVVENLTESSSGAWFALSTPGHDPAVSPETVGAHILRHLLDIAASNLGHRQVSKAVVAVPAKFSPAQRDATVAAYAQAGIKVMRVIEEPTAAAVAYGLDRKPDVHFVLVYDFGGGTLDVSMLYVQHESVQVIATHGDDQLGGSDFDRCVADQLAMQLPAGKAPTGTGAAACGTAVAPCTPPNLRVLGEQMKRALSAKTVAHAACLAVPTSGSPPCHVVNLTLSREQFHAGCADLFARAVLPVDNLLELASVAVDEVDEVVLVGGTSRIPRIRSILRDYFGIGHLNAEIDPDVTVAMGAASIVD